MKEFALAGLFLGNLCLCLLELVFEREVDLYLDFLFGATSLITVVIVRYVE
jgi:hypothetical protein